MNLRTFFKEKELPFAQWEIEHNGQTHLIDSDTIISMILKSKCKKIAKTLSRIDFFNGNVLDYLKFLAEQYIIQSDRYLGEK
jgi:hypothetical protein